MKPYEIFYRVYLAGPIYGCSSMEQVNWRNKVKVELSKNFDGNISTYDPTLIYSEDVRKTDLYLIDKSDVLFAYLWKLSIGTCMEIEHALSKNIPVFLALSKDTEEFYNHKWFKDIYSKSKDLNVVIRNLIEYIRKV